MVKEFYANAIVNRGDKLLGERKEFLSNSCLFGKNPTHATLESSSSTPHVYDEQLDNITTALHEINTKIFGLASIMYSLHSRFDSKFTSLQTQLDEIQRKLEENDQLFHDKKGEMVSLIGGVW